jgi:spermidine/putrescine transport system substrate-binding protein
MLTLCFAGCGSSSATESKGEVNVCSWGEYIDEDLISQFESQTGIKVNYTTCESNEALYSLLKTGGSSYDVIVPSDYMIARLISEDMLEELDYDNIPNFSLIGDDYKNLEYDPTNAYTVPYAWGTTGIIYNTTMVEGEITSWGALFDEQYKGNILMIDNPRDAVGIALLYLGYSLNTEDEGELQEAFDLLEQQKPILQGYVMDQIFDKMESGEAAIGVYYAGDYLVMKETNPDLAFCVPEEGANFFVDAMCIPKGASNKENAEAWINFMASTEACLANMEYIGYASANTEAAEEYAADMDEEDVEVMFPSEETVSRCETFLNLSQDTLDLYDDLWVKLKS